MNFTMSFITKYDVVVPFCHCKKLGGAAYGKTKRATTLLAIGLMDDAYYALKQRENCALV